MKKILAAVLAVLMLVSVFALASCKPDDPEETPNETPNKIPPKDTGDETPDETPEDTDPPVDDVEFEDVDETVYVMEGVSLNLRTTLSFDSTSNIKVAVAEGTELKRTGVSESWSRVVYKDETLYCSTKYLTTEKPTTETGTGDDIVFTDVDEKGYINVPDVEDGAAAYYSKPVRNADYRIGSLKEGTEIKITGVYYENPDDPEKLGWTRFELEGETYYVRNSLVSAEKPATEE